MLHGLEGAIAALWHCHSATMGGLLRSVAQLSHTDVAHGIGANIEVLNRHVHDGIRVQGGCHGLPILALIAVGIHLIGSLVAGGIVVPEGLLVVLGGIVVAVMGHEGQADTTKGRSAQVLGGGERHELIARVLVAVNESSLSFGGQPTDVEEGTRSEFLLVLVALGDRLADAHADLEKSGFDLCLVWSLSTKLQKKRRIKGMMFNV